MRKLAIALLLVLLLTLCGCSSQNANKKEGVSVSAETSSELQENSGINGEAVSGEGDNQSSTLAQAGSENETPGVPFGTGENGGNTNNGSNSQNNKTETTKNNNNNTDEKTTAAPSEETTSSEGVSMPRIPIPRGSYKASFSINRLYINLNRGERYEKIHFCFSIFYYHQYVFCFSYQGK